MQVLHKIYFCSSFLSSDSGTSSNFGNTKATHDHPKPNLEATFFTNLSDQSKPVSCSNLVLAKIPSDIFDKLYTRAQQVVLNNAPLPWPHPNKVPSVCLR